MEDRNEIRKSYRTAAWVGFSVITSLLIILATEELMRSKFHPFYGFIQPLVDTTLLRYVFFGAAILDIFCIRMIQSRLLKKSSEDNAQVVLAKLSRASIVTVCLSEIPAILGFLLFFLRGLNKDFYALLIVSLFLVFMYFPRLGSWEDWIARNSR
jgi:hypothetical protein